MSERYTKLFALTENLYTEGAPVVIAAGSLLKDNQTGKILAQIKYKNISSKIIKAVKVAVRAFDVSGTEIEGIQEYQYLDLSAARDAEFGQKNAIALPDKVTRSFSCECKSIIFSDGTTWEEKGAEWKPLIQPETLQKRLGGLSAQYKRDTVKQAQFIVTDDRDLWICTCGAINRQSEAKCHACHGEKTALLAALDMEALKEHNAAYNKRESERREKETAEAAKKKTKTKKISMIAAACAVVVIAAIVVITQVIVPSSKYNSAVTLMNEGKYDEAIETFEELGDYQDSAILLEECELLAEKEVEKEEAYQNAIALVESGKYDEAIAAFEAIDGYKDSLQKIEAIKQKIEATKQQAYLNAETLLQQGNISEAAISFGKLRGYKDSQERSLELWRSFTDRNTVCLRGVDMIAITTSGELISNIDGFGGGSDLYSITLTDSALYGIKTDGTVFAYTQEFDELEYQGIVNIVGFDDGTVVCLRNDGTILSPSIEFDYANDKGSYVKLVQFYDWLIALNIDGSIYAQQITSSYGDDNFENIITSFEESTDIIDIKSNKNYFWAISESGTTYRYQFYEERRSAAIDYPVRQMINSFVDCILKEDGTVEAFASYWGTDSEKKIAEQISAWKDIVDITAGNEYILGIKSDGSVVVAGKCSCNLSAWNDVAYVFPNFRQKSDNLIAVKKDGSVIVAGDALSPDDYSMLNNIAIP